MIKVKSYATVALLTVAVLPGLGKPAKQGIIPKTQPDGTIINVRIAGDEFFHQCFTPDGYPLQEKDGFFYYCDFDDKGNLIESGIRAENNGSRSSSAEDFVSKIDKSTLETRIRKRAAGTPRRPNASIESSQVGNNPRRAVGGNDGAPFPKGYGLFSDTRFPAYGNQKAIVILVQYKDVKFNSSYNAKEYFTNMLNQEGFSDAKYGGTGSAVDFFNQNSKGAFVPEFDVYGPLTLSNNMSYYGGNDNYGNDKNPAAMVKEACDQLDATVNFKEYDRDGDGIVDNIFIFYAGQGEASYGASDTVWPHSWNMVSAGYRNLKYDGVQIYTYGCSNEWEYNKPDGVGTFIHEFSHVMGLPDLYATSYTNAFTPGSWSALDYGPYNNNGRTPPNYGAFERYALGWIKPYEIDKPLTGTLKPIIENKCAIIRTSKATEFFLLENRQKTGWDTYIPGHGMLIWHVDYNANIWSSNSVNNSASHQYVDIEEADNRQSENTRDGDSFPGTSKKTSFTSTTSPALKNWSGQAINYPITEIAENDGVITFNVLGGGPGWSAIEDETVVAVEASDVGADSFTANWQELADATEYYINVYTKEASGDAILSHDVFNGNIELQSFVELFSPVYEDFISEIDLTCVSEGSSDENILFIYAVSEDGSKRIDAAILSEGENNIHIDYFPEESYQVSFILADAGGNASVTINNLDVCHGHETVEAFLGDYYKFPVGNVLSYRIDRLDENRDYYYTVFASDGENVSNTSNEIKVSTLTTGINVINREDKEEETIYYNIHGIRIDKPSRGIYIERKGSKTFKKILP